MVQTIYRNSGAGMPWPMLTKSNYHEWSLLMARHLWGAVHVSGVGYGDDRRALETCVAVSTELGDSFAYKATVKLVWESIATARVGGDRVRRATLQRLR
jgi:hypothetical protein